MVILHNDSMNSMISKECGVLPDNGEINGKGTLDNLVLVMTDILATPSIEGAKEIKGAITRSLSEAEAQARHRIDHESAFARKGLRSNEGLPSRMTAGNWLLN